MDAITCASIPKMVDRLVEGELSVPAISVTLKLPISNPIKLSAVVSGCEVRIAFNGRYGSFRSPASVMSYVRAFRIGEYEARVLKPAFDAIIEHFRLTIAK